MTDRRALEECIAWLHGRRTGVRYRDLAKILQSCDCTEVAGKSSHHVWAHPSQPLRLPLVDSGRGDVLLVYIVKTRKYLESILETL